MSELPPPEPIDSVAALGQIVELAEQVGLHGLEQTYDDLHSMIAAWEMLDDAIATLSALRREQGDALCEAMPADEIAIDGKSYHRGVTKRDRWDGEGVIRALSQKMVDPTFGEMIDAVPASILRHVLPGVTSISSSWKVGALREEGIDVGAYRTQEFTGHRFTRGDNYATRKPPLEL